MRLVKITVDEDGYDEDSGWHYIGEAGGSECCLCDGQVFGLGEGDAEFKIKEVKRGGITCDKCLRIIREHKAVRL
ncbi:MAG: hypothetical protein JKY80_00815 [Mariprofundaceae bacterium]|nr:hypothetical protein [Mariprofundaceae bacterium]